MITYKNSLGVDIYLFLVALATLALMGPIVQLCMDGLLPKDYDL